MSSFIRKNVNVNYEIILKGNKTPKSQKTINGRNTSLNIVYQIPLLCAHLVSVFRLVVSSKASIIISIIVHCTV